MEKYYNNVPTFYANSIKAWRVWLQKNHATTQSVWLVIFKKESTTPSITYKEAVQEALCFGWIDSKPNKRDEESFYQFFSVRNPKSNWSAVNKKYVAALIANNKMTKAGFDAVELAKRTGTWDALNEVDALVIPPDLLEELKKYNKAVANFSAFPNSVRRGILEWILNAKQPATRVKRITETAQLAEQNIRANQYIKK